MSLVALSYDIPASPEGDIAGAAQRTVSSSDRSQKRAGWITWAPLMIGLLILLIPFSAAYQHGGGPMDEGTLLVYPEMIQRGAIPYRDFETFYAPANPYLLAGVYTIFGMNIIVERTVGLLYRAMILGALFGLTRRWSTSIATGCMLLVGLLLLPLGVVAYAWFGAMACALSFIWIMATPGGKWQCLGGGLLAGLALSFRADAGPAVILAALVLLQPLSLRQRASFVMGAVMGLVPFAVLFLVAGPEQMINNLFLYPVIFSGPARRIPLSAAEPFLVRLFFLQVLAAATNIAVGIWAVRSRPRERRGRVLLALALLGAGVMPQAWQRLDLWHVLFVAFLVVGIWPLTLFSVASLRSGKFPPFWIAVGPTLAVAVLVGAIAPPLLQLTVAAFRQGLQTIPAGSAFVHKGERSFPVPAQRAESLSRILDKLERLSKPGERLFVGPADLRRTIYCDTFIYHLMPKLRPATYFLEMNPMSANRPGSRLASDIASADWVVLNREWDLQNKWNPPANYDSAEATNAVRNHFQFAGEYGPYALFRRVR